MNCNCFDNALKMVREKLDDPMASMNGVYAHNKKTNRLEFRPSISVVYRKRKNDGTFNKKEDEMQLAYDFCPFCGTRIIEPEEKDTPTPHPEPRNSQPEK